MEDEEPPGGLRMNEVRETLRRRKLCTKVLNFKYRKDGDKPPIGRVLDWFKPPEAPFTCEGKCEICSPQFFPATVEVDNVEARQIMASLANAISEDLAFLRRALIDHADFIATRWRKKTRDKRFRFLSKNADLFDRKWAAVHLAKYFDYPRSEEMNVYSVEPPRVGIDLISGQILGPETLQWKDPEGVTQKFHDTWFLPYLDTEVLSEDYSLLLSLLHHRTVNDPEKWLSFDDTNLFLAECLGPVDHVFNPLCVGTKGAEYGKVVNWDAHRMHAGEILGFTKAHLLFTAQHKMMAFLRKIVGGLLVETTEPPKLEIHPKWSQLVNSNFFRSDSTSNWSTSYFAPFSAPPSFNAVDIVELIVARHNSIRDDLELKQTDPEYVQSLVREQSSAKFFETFSKSDKWPFYVDDLFLDPLKKEMYWRQLRGESEGLKKCSEALHKNPCPKTQAEYDAHLTSLFDLCTETFGMLEGQLDSVLFLQRGFEGNYSIRGDGRLNRTNRKYSREDHYPHDMLHWAISNISCDVYRRFTVDASLNFAIIDYVYHNDQKQAARLSQFLLDHLGDMAILYQVTAAVKAQMVNVIPYTDTYTKKANQSFQVEFIKKIRAANHIGEISDGDALGPVLERACIQTPWPGGKKGIAWLKQANAAHRTLDNFWDQLRDLWISKMRNGGVIQAHITEDAKFMDMARNEKHLVEIAALRDHIYNSEILDRERLVQLQNTATEIQTVWGSDTPSVMLSLPIRKMKKRTSAQVEVPPTPPDTTPPSPVQPVRQIAVKRDTLHLLMHMYPESGEESQRSFSWRQFLAAMTDAGFSVLQSQGSAVVFKFHGVEGVNTILVHRPHPESTVCPKNLRWHAKRITKWFGWRREMFVERAKE